MTTVDVVDVNPPYHVPDYPINEYRSPRGEVVRLPEWYRHGPGPSYGRIPLPPGSSDLNAQHDTQPIGQRIILIGRVVDRDGRPIPGALIELWQTNGAGRYADPADAGFFPLDPNFTGAGWCVTDEHGCYQFVTIRPAAYPGARGGLYRPSHLHFSVFGEDLSSRLITQCYFPDDPLLPRDPIVNALGEAGVDRLTARFVGEMTEPNGEDSALAYQYNVVLRGQRRTSAGPDETPPEPPGVFSASQTIGPLYGFALMFPDSEQAADPADPASVHVEGTVFDGQGKPVAWPDCMVELWEGDQFARTRTGQDGRYRAVVRRPAGGDPIEGHEQAPHLEVTVFARGLLKQAQTRLYFPGEVRNEGDPVLKHVGSDQRPRLIATRSGGHFDFDIHLQGPDESVFFDY